MRIGIVMPIAVPPTRGGLERAVDGLRQAMVGAGHECEVVGRPVDESTLVGVVRGYREFAELDVTRFDRVVSVKYPGWMVQHPHHTVLMFHPLRGLYDTYHLFKRPLHCDPQSQAVRDLRYVMTHRADRAVLSDFFRTFADAVGQIGPDHPDLVFPGPFAREVVHWLDRIAMAPSQVERHLALSRTVAARADYFPPGISPRVVYLPSDLPPGPHGRSLRFFTASRLDGPKRLDLLIDAYKLVPGRQSLCIAGTGPEDRRLRERAADDPRITFAGYVSDADLAALYSEAIAVPFLPYDEDLGLVTLEAFSRGAPVVTCRDSGGPTEFVADGVTGLVADPTPHSLADALTRLATNPALAATMGEAAHRRARRVTWAGAVHRILDDEHDVWPALTHPAGPMSKRRGWGELKVPPVATGRPEAPAPAAPRFVDLARIGRARPKVVVTATFRIDQPRGGGQLRCHHLYGALAAHADVEVLSLVDPADGAGAHQIAPGLRQTMVPRSPDQVAAGADLSAEARMPVTDIVAGTHVWATPAYLDAVARAARTADLVVLAEPYLYPTLAEAGLDLPFVYDAFNVEADLKAAVLPATEVGRRLLAQVIEVEGAAMRGATAVTACSSLDADELAQRYGRDRTDITVIPNGTDIGPPIADPAVRHRRAARWRDRFVQVGLSGRHPEHLAVFFGSWHPPNLDAVRLMIELAPELDHTLFLGVGSHGMAFADEPVPPNVVFAGVVTDTVKDALLGCADVALNPMRTGSGTNLKLLEYLASGAPVVSTPFGARGIDVVDGEHLLLADPAGFAEAIRASLADEEAARRRAEKGRAFVAAHYGWPALGDRLWSVVERVAGARTRTSARS